MLSDAVSKQQCVYLEILWELLPASIPRVHSDEEPDTWVQADSAAISENKLLLALTDGTQDTVDLQQSVISHKCEQAG